MFTSTSSDLSKFLCANILISEQNVLFLLRKTVVLKGGLS